MHGMNWDSKSLRQRYVANDVKDLGKKKGGKLSDNQLYNVREDRMNTTAQTPPDQCGGPKAGRRVSFSCCCNMLPLIEQLQIMTGSLSSSSVY